MPPSTTISPISPISPHASTSGHRRAWGVLAAVLLIAAFAPTLAELVTYWWDHPEYSHGFLMPVIAGWILWQRRAELSRVEVRPTLTGALVLLLALALLLLARADRPSGCESVHSRHMAVHEYQIKCTLGDVLLSFKTIVHYRHRKA